MADLADKEDAAVKSRDPTVDKLSSSFARYLRNVKLIQPRTEGLFH